MHIERLLVSNLRGVGDRELDFTMGPDRLRSWTLLSSDPGSALLLCALALTSLGQRQVRLLDRRSLPRLPKRAGGPAHLEVVQIRHAPRERGAASPIRRHLGWAVEATGEFHPLAKSAMRHHNPLAQVGRPESGQSNFGRLVLGYGRRIGAHAGTDCFDILPDQRLRRCAGLFQGEARLTDPAAFLRRLHHKSKYRAGRARALLVRLSADLRVWMDVDLEACLGKHAEFEARWQQIRPADRAALTVYLDIARHVFDASACLDVADPFAQPGIVLLDRPERWCSLRRLGSFFKLLARRFPQLQFMVGLSPSARRRFPVSLRRQGLDLPDRVARRDPAPSRRLRRGTILLVDVDGTLPNLALMKLSRHWKERGRRVVLARGVRSLPRCDEVQSSCVFTGPTSRKRLEVLERTFGNNLQTGGSGVDLQLRLPSAIENLAPDYSLYPELDDRALGFLTRGCPQRCPFCVVPVKEGPPRQVSDLDTLLQGRRKLILLDDNLLAHPAALGFLEEMARRHLAVNFNQTLDLRRLTLEAAELLRHIRCSNVGCTRPAYHFSLNDARGLERMREHYRLLQTTARDNVEFVCMYGFNTSLAEDVARFRFLRSLPGAYVFVQRYRPVLGGPAPDLSRLFDERADGLIDELVRIVFRQNMKSMETYYRWLAVQYAAQRGRVHRRLVETLFRYNSRPRMGSFLDRLETLAAGNHRTRGPAGE